MIISANNSKNFISRVSAVSNNDPFACRIISLYNSYQPELVFVDYWLVIDDDTDECCGAIARNGSTFLLFLADNRCVDEVSSFMRVAGATEILYDAVCPLEMFGGSVSTGYVLMRNNLYDTNDLNRNCIEPDIKDFYNLILSSADENFTPPCFEDFYVDVNHKLRHKAMRVVGITDNGRLAAAAMTVAESDTCAVIGAVACNPKFRNLGYGTAVVKYISNSLINENKTVYLHRAENSNESFYEKLGFVQTGKWKEYRFGG